MAWDDRGILKLLRRMDGGYVPSERERQELARVRLLDWSNNKLTRLPESMGSLTGLTVLDLSDNNLTSLPEWIGNLAGVTTLNLSHNDLTSLPESMGSLTGLIVLVLRGNHLTNLPESMGALTRLTNLDLSGNHLTSLSESIGGLTRLTRLDLSGNHLTSLPESMGSLTGLTFLDLTGNHLTSLPESMGSLTGLTFLSLAANDLTNLPEWIGGLTRLTYFSLWGNRLTSLPESMDRLTRLYWLNLSNNQLTSLPEWLLNLNLPFFQDGERHDEGIILRNTTLSLQPVSLFDQSGDKSPNRSASRKLIEDYFRTEHIPLREAKVILLGDAAAGKTYTVRRLKNGCEKGDYKTETTHGILIEELPCQRDGTDYTVRVWDFGGQDIMNEMHRCFLTERTCYAVLVDTRNNNQTQRARRWLRTVRSVAPDAPVVLLVNEMTGGTNLDLDAVSLRKEFPNLREVRHCSARDAEREEFRREVETPLLNTALGMDSCKMTLPESWEQVRQELLKLREKNYYIDRAGFHRLCDDHGVPKDDQLRVWLLNWFNDMGVCFSYHLEDGRERETDYKILEPKWLTSAIYRLLWEKEQNDDGVITHNEIRLILKNKGSEEHIKKGIPCLPGVTYEPEECEYVLEIMRKFGISYQVHPGKEFMPTLCKPDSKRDPAPERYSDHVSVQFRYELLPEKVIHGLMIYCYRSLTGGRMWRKGFWLESREYGLCAVVYTAEDKDASDTLQIDVYATEKGADAAFWLQLLGKEVREMNRRFGLNAEEWVLARAESEEKWFKLDVVWNWRRKNRKTLMGDAEEFPIRPLLERVYGRWLPDAEMAYAVADVGRVEDARGKEAAWEEQIPRLNDLFELMEQLMQIVQSNEKLLRQFQASRKSTALGKIRELMGDAANLKTIYDALAPALKALFRALLP